MRSSLRRTSFIFRRRRLLERFRITKKRSINWAKTPKSWDRKTKLLRPKLNKSCSPILWSKSWRIKRRNSARRFLLSRLRLTMPERLSIRRWRNMTLLDSRRLELSIWRSSSRNNSKSKKMKEMKREPSKGSTRIWKNKSKKSNRKKKNKERELKRSKRFSRRNKKRSNKVNRRPIRNPSKISMDLKFYKAKRRALWSFHQAKPKSLKRKSLKRSPLTLRPMDTSSCTTFRLQRRRRIFQLSSRNSLPNWATLTRRNSSRFLS